MNEGVTPSPSDCRPVHRVALPVLSVSKPVVFAPHASPKCALAVTRLGGTSFLQALSCVFVVASCHSCGTTFVVALLFAPRGCLGCEALVILEASLRLGCYAARLSIEVTNEGGSPSPSDRRPVHRVALPICGFAGRCQ